jgi:hypothetical protein
LKSQEYLFKENYWQSCGRVRNTYLKRILAVLLKNQEYLFKENYWQSCGRVRNTYLKRITGSPAEESGIPI